MTRSDSDGFRADGGYEMSQLTWYISCLDLEAFFSGAVVPESCQGHLEISQLFLQENLILVQLWFALSRYRQ